MGYLFLFGIFGAVMAAAVPARQQRIVGGEPTTIETYPYMSNMEQDYWVETWFQACGGTLITSTTVVSAAHCYEGASPSTWRVRLGSSYASSGGSVHYVNHIKIHEAYTGSITLENDVAMIYLATPAVFSDSVRVARIAGPNYILPAGTPVTSVGWGALQPGGQYPEQVQHVETYLIDHAICTERYAELKSQLDGTAEVNDGMICAGILDVGGKDACQGDSGGPLIHQGDVLVGITSWGYGCAHETYPGVNARVSYYSNWIVANGSS